MLHIELVKPILPYNLIHKIKLQIVLTYVDLDAMQISNLISPHAP